MQTAAGVPHPYARATLLNAVTLGANGTVRDSEVVDARGYSKMWLFVKFANMAAGTDFVGALEILTGISGALADMVAMAVAAGNTMIGALPTGFTIDGQSDGYAIAATFESNSLIMLAFDRVPPFLVTRLTNTTVAIAGTVTVTVDAHFQ